MEFRNLLGQRLQTSPHQGTRPLTHPLKTGGMNKTVSIETALLLRDAGWEQISTWPSYVKTEAWHLCDGQVGSHDNCRSAGPNLYPGFDEVDAPDVSELLEALPGGTKVEKYGDEHYYAGHPNTGSDGAKTPAEALALLWLELRKQKLV